MANANIMYTNIISAASLVRRLPQCPLKKPEIIIREPPNISAAGTMLGAMAQNQTIPSCFVKVKEVFDNHVEKKLFLRKLVKSNHMKILVSQRASQFFVL